MVNNNNLKKQIFKETNITHLTTVPVVRIKKNCYCAAEIIVMYIWVVSLTLHYWNLEPREITVNACQLKSILIIFQPLAGLLLYY